jgi:hypothetical protein
VGEKARHFSIPSNLRVHFNLNVGMYPCRHASYDPPRRAQGRLVTCDPSPVKLGLWASEWLVNPSTGSRQDLPRASFEKSPFVAWQIAGQNSTGRETSFCVVAYSGRFGGVEFGGKATPKASHPSLLSRGTRPGNSTACQFSHSTLRVEHRAGVGEHALDKFHGNENAHRDAARLDWCHSGTGLSNPGK